MFELRFVPRMKELPTPEYVSQYLAHLGIHPKILDAVIFDAYCAAGCNPKNEWTSSIKDLEDPFTAHYFSEFAAAPPSSNFTPPDSMPLQHHEKSIDHFQPQWSGVSSSSAEEHSSLDSSNDYTLFGETYPSAFRLH
uniref:Uncharacterized protein n=1 Tax=Panagrolaimus superbus TaxID=310955 RepID=A0A914YX08_9BILA